MKNIVLVLVLSLLFNCNGSAQKNTSENNQAFKITKTDEQWKSELTTEQYFVMRKAGTERPFSSPLNKIYEKGTYVCAACNTPLFKSENKFDSGSGWPSFDSEIKGNIDFTGDNLYFGIEEHCAVCGGHLGHVFNDGPRNTTGKRHCVNGVALKFIPSE